MSSSAGFIFTLALLPLLRLITRLPLKELLPPLLFHKDTGHCSISHGISTTTYSDHEAPQLSSRMATESRIGPVNRDSLLKATEEQLCTWIELAVDDYTTSPHGATQLTDEQYDDLVATAVRRFPHRKEWLELVQVADNKTAVNVKQEAQADTQLTQESKQGENMHWPLTSLDKVHEVSELRAFLKRAQAGPPAVVQSGLVVQPKLDGQSVQVVFERPGTTRMYTRMKPRGQDISFLLEFIQLQPGTLFFKPDVYPCSVRGELILPDKVFQECQLLHDPEAVNARTMLTGAVNGAIVHHQKQVEWTAKEQFLFKNMVLVLYSVLCPEECTFGEQDDMLVQWEQAHRWHEHSPEKAPVQLVRCLEYNHAEAEALLSSDTSVKQLSQLLTEWRAESPFTLDGLALKWLGAKPETAQGLDGQWRNPKYAVAFKVRDGGVQCTVNFVEWNITRYGVLFPRVHLTEPVRVGNVDVSHATGHSATFIQDQQIMPGTVIEVIHSGSVIPYITRVISVPADKDVVVETFPPIGSYAWDKNHVHIKATGQWTAEKHESIESKPGTYLQQALMGQLDHFCKLFDFKDVGDKMVEALVMSGVVVDMKTFFHLDADSIPMLTKHVAGVGKKKAQNLVQCIELLHGNVQNWSNLHGQLSRINFLADLMSGSGVFGHGLGVSQARSLLTTATQLRMSPPWTTDWLMDNVDLFGPTRSHQVLTRWPAFVVWLINDLGWRGAENDLKMLWAGADPIPVVPVQPKPKIKVTLTLSGFRDKTGERARQWSTDRVQVHTADSINKETTAVVVLNDEGRQSTKAKQATKRELPVLTVDEVPDWVGNRL